MSDLTTLVRDDDAPLALHRRLQVGVRESAPNYRQIVLLVGIAIAVAIGMWVFSWSQQPGYAPLYSGLSTKDAGEVADALRAAEIPYRIDAATGAVTVPEDQVHEVRLKLATQGLPQGNPRAGSELIDGEQGFGVSQFVEGVRYQHALETELGRTIATLRPVHDARVHLALPKQSAFTRNREMASASVVLDLYPGRALEPNQVAAIVHMVSSSIPDMPPESVTVIDQTGHMLTNPDPNSEDAVNTRQFEQAHRLETAYAERIRRLLEPIAGAGRVSAQVNVDMDFSVVEEAREVYGNDQTKVRSEQTAEQTSATPQVGGIPGATSNTPPPGPAATAAANVAGNLAGSAAGNASRSSTRNYELDRTLTHTSQGPGRIKRVSAAVLVDNIPQAGEKGVTYRALSADELARLESLVREAVGFETQRGDSVSVVNAAFVHADAGTAAAAAPGDPAAFWKVVESTPPLVKDSLRLLVGGIAVLALIFGVLRPSLRQLVAPKRDVADGEHAGENRLLPSGSTSGAGGAPLSLPPATPAMQEDAFVRARTAVNEDPKRVAQVVKNWMNTNG